jgi:hypothetical protein
MNKNSAKTAKKPAKLAPKVAKKSVKLTKSAQALGKKITLKAPRREVVASNHSVAEITVRAPSFVPRDAHKILRTSSPPVQPGAEDAPLKAHKYHVGDTVYFTTASFGRAAANGSYTVVKLLPSEGDDYQYRIKSSGEAFERVAKESQLDRA